MAIVVLNYLYIWDNDVNYLPGIYLPSKPCGEYGKHLIGCEKKYQYILNHDVDYIGITNIVTSTTKGTISENNSYPTYTFHVCYVPGIIQIAYIYITCNPYTTTTKIKILIPFCK